jgi:hypothetical protein
MIFLPRGLVNLFVALRIRKGIMKEIVHSFKHIARDFMIYILPGLIVIFYGLYFSYFKSYYEEFNCNDHLINICSILIASYIIGHFILGFMEVTFVLTKIDECVMKILFKKDFLKLKRKLRINGKHCEDFELEILAFKNRDAYDFFVERHTQLSLFRWNISGTFLIISIFSFIMIRYESNCSLFWIGIANLFMFIVMFIFSIRTELDGHLRRKFLAEKEYNKT